MQNKVKLENAYIFVFAHIHLKIMRMVTKMLRGTTSACLQNLETLIRGVSHSQRWLKQTNYPEKV